MPPRSRALPGECSRLHGHTWDVEVTIVGHTLDHIGIVYDFKTLRDDLARVLEPLDHGYLNDVPPFDAMNPTAENLARHIYGQLSELVLSTCVSARCRSGSRRWPD